MPVSPALQAPPPVSPVPLTPLADLAPLSLLAIPQPPLVLWAALVPRAALVPLAALVPQAALVHPSRPLLPKPRLAHPLCHPTHSLRHEASRKEALPRGQVPPAPRTSPKRLTTGLMRLGATLWRATCAQSPPLPAVAITAHC
jgi:hypothetical protein